MSDLVVVVVNGEVTVQYDRRRPLSGRQQEYLANMDRRMDAGITLDGETIADPAPEARARLVATHLVEALTAEDEGRVAAMLSWLASRLPGLKQVKVQLGEGQVEVELVFDEAYAREEVIRFVSRDQLKPTRH